MWCISEWICLLRSLFNVLFLEIVAFIAHVHINSGRVSLYTNRVRLLLRVGRRHETTLALVALKGTAYCRDLRMMVIICLMAKKRQLSGSIQRTQTLMNILVWLVLDSWNKGSLWGRLRLFVDVLGPLNQRNSIVLCLWGGALATIDQLWGRGWAW